MSKIQFFYNRPMAYTGQYQYRKNTYTVAHSPILLTKEALAQFILNPDTLIQINFGVSFCHPKDQFKKKTGRDLASAKMALYYFKLKAVFTFDDYYQVNIEGVGHSCNIALKLYKDSNKTRVINIHV